jgi:predicted CxxxxCH...CXXCH cytochrome family protein
MTSEAAPASPHGVRAPFRSFGWVVLALLVGSCAEERMAAVETPVYATDIRPVLEQRCVGCHDGASPAGAWRAASYLDTIACGADSTPATLPADDRAPILRALDSDTHRGRLGAGERALLEDWVRAGAPAFRGTVHDPGIVDPRSPGWHGKVLRDAKWRPMLDPNDANACGRCHDGAPSRPTAVTLAAPGATACTTCHAEPQGVLACGTCHGQGRRAYPPRDPCFFPNDAPTAGAHTAHVEPSALRSTPLACSTCHPIPGADVISGVHGNGSIEVAFDAAVVGAEASYDRTSGQCAVACHDRGGARARPSWSETDKMRCGDCHSSPPANHFPGPCSKCHAEADAAGTSLSPGPLHLNGHTDLGDGSGACGACHGHGEDPWPTTGAHASHKNPTLAAPTDCATCHRVPPAVLSPGHLDGVVEVALSGRALDRSSPAEYRDQSCNLVACHGNGLVDPPLVVPVWTDASGAAKRCGACHGIPPTQHTASTSCDRATCHGSEVTRTLAEFAISETGKALHVNGAIDLDRP